MVLSRLFYSAIWIIFVIYAFFFAPPNQPDTFTLIRDLSTGHWSSVNPWTTSLFNGMGLWPMIYTALLLRDGQRQRFPAWPFAIASFLVGAFAILPYLALRESPLSQEAVNPNPIRGWESRWLGIVLSIGFVVLLVYGFSQGSWGEFTLQWSSDRFVHVMGLDFCLLSLLIPSLSLDDRSIRSESPPQWLDFIPVIGALLYLSLRGPVEATVETS